MYYYKVPGYQVGWIPCIAGANVCKTCTDVAIYVNKNWDLHHGDKICVGIHDDNTYWTKNISINHMLDIFNIEFNRKINKQDEELLKSYISNAINNWAKVFGIQIIDKNISILGKFKINDKGEIIVDDEKF